MCVDLLYNVQNKNGLSHSWTETRHCNPLKIDEEIFQQLNRSFVSHADISEEIFEDYRRHVADNLRMSFPTSSELISIVFVVDQWNDR